MELLATLRSVEHNPIELILLRQLASRLPLPVTLVDAEGAVVYINPANERLLGLTQAAVAEFPYDRVHELIEYRHADGSPMKVEDRPLAVALHDRRPQQTTIILNGADGVPHRVEVTAFPLDSQGGAPVGAMSIFWEADGDS
jgi:PAS domain S-box-containing protein